MEKYGAVATVLAATILMSGCIHKPVNPDGGKSPVVDKKGELNVPDTKLVSQLPDFVREENEIQIADNFNHVDPSWVIGALVNRETKMVHAMDSFLKKDAKPKLTPSSEVVFKELVDNSITINNEWLAFIKATISSNARAEVTVMRTGDVSVLSESIDKAGLINHTINIPKSERDKYGIIIGYSDYLLSAAYFRNFGVSGAASGFGAKIDGNWFSKAENASVQHRIVAVWAPLPYVLEVIKKTDTTDLTKSTTEAINQGNIQVEKIPELIHSPVDQ
ncbi:hypothetical protein [Pseudomonas bijieensis]|uniref:hypothetical protein n=1 Tax=Pseudomonas bijieensis TaxID=2681983 RepID=UPI001E572BF6|nr:hypothetical protein [Pseudomonas bijieensis]MCD9114685.1 hypothetical protein [Pseudomonas bijieensis]